MKCHIVPMHDSTLSHFMVFNNFGGNRLGIGRGIQFSLARFAFSNDDAKDF
jgi:hypothetical protein